MKAKSKSVASNLVSVTLEIPLATANTVCVAGTFNEWNPTASPLRRNGDGRWSATLRLPPGQYEYRLVVDGGWCDVPGARDTVANPYGSLNALLSVAPSRQAARGRNGVLQPAQQVGPLS